MASGKTWRCKVCGYVVHGDTVHDRCPVCDAPPEAFEEYSEIGHLSHNNEIEHTGELDQTALQSERRILIVGAGIAGLTAAETVRRNAPYARITLICREAPNPYFRMSLTRFLADELSEEDLWMHPLEWYHYNQIDLLLGREVTALDADSHSVTLDDGQSLVFDRLILACGSHAFAPPLPGVDRACVTRLRTLNDARLIRCAAEAGQRIVVVGGGILGLETAGGLAKSGAEVTVIEGSSWLMTRQLDEDGGKILQRHAEEMGITFCLNVHVKEIHEGSPASVELDNGTILQADLVVITAGVRANSHLAREAGIDVGRGIVVNDHLETEMPHILAAGDVAEHRGVSYGIWPAAMEQGRVAGLNACGIRETFNGIPRSTTLKVLDIGVTSLGDIKPEDGAWRVLRYERDSSYFALFSMDHKLQGAVLIGNWNISRVKELLAENADLSTIVGNPDDAQEFLSIMT